MAFNRMNMKKMTFFEMLGIPPNADRKTIHKSFVRSIRKINPKGIRLQEKDKDYLRKAIFVRDKLKEGYSTLMDAALRRKYMFTLRESREIDEKKKAEALILFNRGMSEFKGGNFQKARETFQRAILLDPKSPVYYNMMESIEKEETTLNSAKFFHAGVIAFSQKNDFERAVKLIKKAISLTPGQVSYHQKLAEILGTRAEMRSDAAQNYELASELDPGNAELRMSYAMFVKSTGNKQEAANKFQEVLKWNPDHIAAKKELMALRKDGIVPKKQTVKETKETDEEVEI
jgi:tetratricopeptide (TPR) repeat protein